MTRKDVAEYFGIKPVGEDRLETPIPAADPDIVDANPRRRQGEASHRNT
ncbi:hypothetical protein [Actibacterium sp. MT2.3-13A]|nr:hypothetical protein [Actibacterium sp. MT2.3-13A]